MIRVIVRGPGDRVYQLDTPDPLLIGPWLMALFDSFKLPQRHALPIQFLVENEELESGEVPMD